MSADEFYLRHILDSIEKIERYTVNGKSEFDGDEKTQDAVIRNFEIIGEAVKNISPEVKLTYSQIEWTKIAGMRDKLIHHYFGVKLDVVWETVVSILPEFKAFIQSLLADSPGSTNLG